MAVTPRGRCQSATHPRASALTYFCPSLIGTKPVPGISSPGSCQSMIAGARSMQERDPHLVYPNPCPPVPTRVLHRKAFVGDSLSWPPPDRRVREGANSLTRSWAPADTIVSRLLSSPRRRRTAQSQAEKTWRLVVWALCWVKHKSYPPLSLFIFHPNACGPPDPHNPC